MTEAALGLLGGNALSATILFAAALVAQRFAPPAIRHVAWLAVVVRLLIPPILSVPLPSPDFVPRPASTDQITVTADSPGTLSMLPPASDPLPEPSLAASTLPAVPDAAPRTIRSSRPAAERWLRPLPLLATIELAGAVVFLTLALLRWRRFRRLLDRTRVAPPALRERARTLATTLGVTRPPRVLLTEERISPLLVGGPRAAIVLPALLLDRLSPDEVDAILAHELGHVRRGDAWIRPLEMLATALYWWFPLLPAARRRLRDAEEAACDALVVRALPHLRRAYAQGLLETVEFLSGCRKAPVFTTGAADARNLKERIVRILKPDASSSPFRRPVPLVALALAAAAVSLTPGWTPVDAAVREDRVPAVAPETPELPLLPVPATVPEVSELPMLPALAVAPGLPLALAAVESDVPAPRLPSALPMSPEDLARAGADLEARRAELTLQRQLTALHQNRSELDLHMNMLQQTRELARMQAELEHLARAGHKAEAEMARHAHAQLKHHIEIEERLGKQEHALQAEIQELELQRAEAEMLYGELQLNGDEEGAQKAALEIEELGRRARALSLDQMRLHLERQEEELQMRRAEYEQMVSELEEEANEAKKDAKD